MDKLRRALWAQQRTGQGCDVTLAAADGRRQPAHRVVVATACPALRGALGGGQAEVSVPATPMAAVLEMVLRWAYLGQLQAPEQAPGLLRVVPEDAESRRNLERQVLPAAVALGMDQLAEECDYLLVPG